MLKFDTKLKLIKLYSFFDSLFFPMSIWLLFFNNFITNSELAYILAITYTIGALLEVPSGMLADKIGKKRTVIFGLLLYAISMFGHIFVIGYYTALLVRILSSIGNSLKSGADEALIYEFFQQNGKQDEYKSEFAALQFYSQIGTAIGTISGGFLFILSIYMPYILVMINQLTLIVITLYVYNIEHIQMVSSDESFKVRISNAFDKNIAGLTHMLNSEFKKVMLIFFLMSFLLYVRNGVLGYAQFESFGYNTGELLSLMLFVSFISSGLIFKFLVKKINIDSINKVYMLMGILMLSYILSNYNIFYWGIIIVIIRDVIALLFDNYRSDLMNRYIDDSSRATILSFYLLIRKLTYSSFAFMVGYLLVEYDANQILYYLGFIVLNIMLIYFVINQTIWKTKKLQ